MKEEEKGGDDAGDGGSGDDSGDYGDDDDKNVVLLIFGGKQKFVVQIFSSYLVEFPLMISDRLLYFLFQKMVYHTSSMRLPSAPADSDTMRPP